MTKLLTKEKPEIINNHKDKFETVLFLPVRENRKCEGGLRTKGFFKKSYENKPLISIITVVYNGEKYLEDCILSVLNQTYDNIEYIMIDGDSKDNTINIIKKYEDQIDYWISEKDNGIYDAMNKGLTVCSGNFIGILNSDDKYLNNAIEISINKIMAENTDYSIASIRHFSEKNISITKSNTRLLDNSTIFQEMPYPHISAFISKSIYKKVGLFNTKYKIASDHEMALKITRMGFKYCLIDEVIAEVNSGGISDSVQSNIESKNIAIEQGKGIINANLTFIIQVTKVTIARLLPIKILKFIQRLINSRHI